MQIIKNKTKINEIHQYYVSQEFNPTLPDDARMRHYRFKLADKSWRKAKRIIKNKEELIISIVKLGGCDIYYSQAKWARPHIISTKESSGTYIVADNLLLGSDFIIDIDAKEPITLEGLDLARKSANNLYEAMKKHSDKYEFLYFANTGYKGFRLAYKDKTQLPKSSRKRIDFVEKNRKLFIDNLFKEIHDNINDKKYYKINTFFDREMTENILCVFRVLGTVHSTTGFISVKLPTSYLKRNIKTILNHIPCIRKKRPGIPEREMTNKGDIVSSPRPRLEDIEKNVSGLASFSPTPKKCRYFFSNRVLGIKRGYIPIFMYQENQTYYKKEIKRLQKKYNLGNIYLFQYKNQKIAISLKTMQRRQLQKVLNDSSSRTKHTFKKYKKIFVPFLLVFLEKMKEMPTGYLSRGHSHYVDPKKITGSNYCGWEQIELIKANFEDEHGL